MTPNPFQENPGAQHGFFSEDLGGLVPADHSATHTSTALLTEQRCLNPKYDGPDAIRKFFKNTVLTEKAYFSLLGLTVWQQT